MSEMPPDPNQYELFTADELSEDSLKDNEINGKTTLPAPDLLIDLSDNNRPINKY